MKFRDKLLQLRKKSGLTQAELSEEINISRQSISKWEVGTAVPDVENIVALSNLFDVSVDYLVNDEITSQGDLQPVKAICNEGGHPVSTKKINYRYILIRVIAFVSIAAIAVIIGIITHTLANMMLWIHIAFFVVCVYYAIKLMIFLINKRT